MKKLEKIYNIAVDVRKVCVELADNDLSQKMDFHCMTDTLSCMCACASWILRNELRRNGIPASICWGEFVDKSKNICGGHVWVKWKDWYIDLTAEQFSWFFNEDPKFEPVMIFHRKKDKNISQFYYNVKHVRSLATLRGWPDSQNPACFVLEKEVRKFIRERLDKAA